jgi:rod shape-determining protein MreD
MIRVLLLLACALLFLVSQTTLLPILLPHYFKPELLLILLVYLCLTESLLRGALLAWGLGLLLDSCGGTYLGLHATIYLVIFIVGHSSAQTLNTESPLLLLFMVFCASLLQSGLLILFGIFADLQRMTPLLLQRATFQGSINVLAAFLLITLITALQRRFAPRLVIPGFAHLRNAAHGA